MISPFWISQGGGHSHKATVALTMYSTNFLPSLIGHLKVTRKIGSLPFEFDATSGKLVLIKSPWRVRASQLQSIISLGYFLVLLCHSFFGKLPMLKRLQGFPFLACYAVLVPCGWNVGLDTAPIQIINSILNFEKGLLRGNCFF